MQLGIEALKEAGCFAGAPVEKEITWKQGDATMTAKTFVRRLSYRSAISDMRTGVTSNDDLIAGRIASCICDEKGKPVFSVADITGEADLVRGPLDHNLTIALLNAIFEVNSLVKTTA
jgi:hypothetical protein